MKLNEIREEMGAYVLLGGNGQYMYKGSTRNLKQRLKNHVEGKVARTRNRRPLRLIHFEYTKDYTEARQRENWLKLAREENG